MNFWRAILASLLSLVCTLAVSGYVTLQTLNTTVLNRDEVKGWLDKSGVYNNLLNNVISGNQTVQGQLNSDSSVIGSDSLKSSLNQTFTPSYVKQAAEQAINGIYDWLNGTASTISFNVDTTTKKDDFISNLSSTLQPQLAALPQCTSLTEFNASNPTCLPPGTTAQQTADDLATDAANQTSIFQQPVNNQTVAQASTGSQNSGNASLTDSQNAQQARSIVSNLRLWLLWLPIIAVVSGGLMVALSQHKFKAGKHLAGRLTVGLAITCAAGLLVANIGRTFSLRNYVSGANSSIMTGVVEPIIHQAAPDIGSRLALVSGIIGVITLAIWIALLIVKKRRDKEALLSTAAAVPTQTPPSTPHVDSGEQPPTTPRQL